MFKKRVILPFMIVLALFLTACGADNANSDNKTDPVNNQDATTNDAGSANNTDATADVSKDAAATIKIMPEEAFDIYMEKHPDTMVKQIQLDKSMGNYLYKVEGFAGNIEYEVEIDPIDGTITKEHMETDDDLDELEITRVHAEKVMALVDQAIAAAGDGAKLEEWTLEMDDGIVELDVEIDKKGFDKVEHTYNVETGQLIDIDN